MFIFYSTETSTETYIVNSNSNVCKKCGTHERLVLTKTFMRYKLFWIIPLFSFTSFNLRCPNCGKYIKISKTEGKALMELSLAQRAQNANQYNQDPFANF